MKKKASKELIDKFITLIYPDATELAKSMFDEETCIKDAIELIESQMAQLEHERLRRVSNDEAFDRMKDDLKWYAEIDKPESIRVAIKDSEVLVKSLKEKNKALSAKQERLYCALEIANRQFRHAKDGNSQDEKCIVGCAKCTVERTLNLER